MKGQIARVVGRVSILAAALIAVLATRVVSASHEELRVADRLRTRGDVDSAIVHYRRAVRFYAPGNPYVSEALAALRQIAREADTADNEPRALSAWRAIHAGILAGRSFYVPHREALAEADARLAALAATDPPAIDLPHSEASRRRAYLAALGRAADRDPSLFPTLLLLAGFAAWVGGALGLMTQGLDLESRLLPSAARRFGTIMLVGFLAFVVGLALA